jgi:hypothetical protein
MTRIWILLCLTMACVACSSGYQWQYCNYSQYSTDTLQWSDGTVLQTDLPALNCTPLKPIPRGSYTITAITQTGRYTLSFFISGKGKGNKTLILDDSGQFGIADNIQ